MKTKNKFFAFLLAIIMLFPPLFSACSLGDILGGGSTNTPAETPPTMTIALDEKLTKNDSTGWYNLTLDAEESYKVNISLGDYEGTKYYICFECSSGEDNVTLNSDGTITAKALSSTSWAYIHFGLKEEGKSSWVGSKYETLCVKINKSTTVVPQDVTISFAKNSGMKYDKSFSFANWFFNIPRDGTFTLNPVVTGATNYTIEFKAQVIDPDNNFSVLNVTQQGVVSVNPDATQSYGIIYINVRANGHLTSLSVRGYIDGTEEGDNLDYIDARLSLPEVSPETDGGRIELKKRTYGDEDYDLTIPYENNYYEIPNVELTGYVGSYHIYYEPIQEDAGKVGVKQDPVTQKLSVAVTKAYVTLAISAETAANHTGDVIDVIYIRIKLSKVGPGEFSLRDYDNQEIEYENEQEITILTNERLHLMPVFNHWNVRSRTDSSLYTLSYTISNRDVVNHEGFTNAYHSLTGIAEGSAVVTFYFSQKDNNDDMYEYEFTITINVVARQLERIFVAHPEAIRISENSVAINGKIYAEYTNNYLVVINSKAGLSYVITTVDETTKHIKFTYNDGITTKTCEYDVNLSASFEYTKVNLSNNYYDYWQDRQRLATQTEGEVKVLAIPVWFTNSSSFFDDTKKDSNNKTQSQQILEDLPQALSGTSVSDSYKTLEEYYEEESFGKVDLQVTFCNTWCPLDIPSTSCRYHGQENVVESTREVASFAVDWYFTTTGKSLSEFDGNNDGVIDAVMIFYGSNYVGSPTTQDDYSQAGRAYVGRGYPTSYALSVDYGFTNYSFISCFNIYSRMQSVPSVWNQLKAQDDLSNYGYTHTSTIIHEFGHMFGLYDLYDTVNDSEIFPAGMATMQDISSAGHDPYSVMALGWANPYVFDSSDTTLDNQIEIEISDFQSSGDLILLSNSWNANDSVFDEYILIELFTPTGLNAYNMSSCQAGVRIWHINATLNLDNEHMYKNDSEVGENDNLVKNLVHYIRNDKTSAYGRAAATISDETMFHEGDIFTVEDYDSQFVENGTMDNGCALGWSVSIGAIQVESSGNATVVITITKNN